MNYSADILIVTATKTESKAVIEVFRDVSGQPPQPISIDNRMYHHLGTINGADVFLVQCEMGAGGLGASLSTVQKGIYTLSPAAVIMTGIAFGVNAEKQSLGDILVSRQLMLYDSQRVSTTKKGKLKLIPRGDRPHASPWLLDRFRSADIYWDESDPKVRFGLILSGEKLVDNINFRDQLSEFESEAIGGEMEGAGLYAACQEAKVDWIVVKSICDWADGNKSQNQDTQQQLAAHNAAKFVLHVLQHATLKREEKKRELAPSTNAETKRAQVTILLNRELHEFTSDEQNSFVFALSRIVNVPPEQIQILRVAPGSVLLTMEMPEESAKSLLSLFLQKDSLLDDLKISKVELKQTPKVSHLPITSPSTIDRTGQPVISDAISQSHLSSLNKYENTVFVSYAWDGESEHTVNTLEGAFANRGINIVRDKRTLNYKDSIKEFENRIGRGQCVVLVISDKYLRSEHCMHELVEIAENKQFYDRIFPIVLADADIYNPMKRLSYIKYWETKRDELANAIRELDPANLQGIRDDIDLYDRIRDNISRLINILTDMNALTPESHSTSGFSTLLSAVEHAMVKR